jgi:hypothetical protein
MKVSVVFFSLLATAAAAPATNQAEVDVRSNSEAKENLEARAPSCKTGADDCVHACAGGSAFLNCYGSYVCNLTFITDCETRNSLLHGFLTILFMDSATANRVAVGMAIVFANAVMDEHQVFSPRAGPGSSMVIATVLS